MAVHYKFNAAKEYDTLPVDGLHISLADLKEAIIHHKRLGKGDLCDLQVTNAETKETYTDDKALIPKNSSLIIARVPIDPSQKKNWDLSRDDKELLLSNPEYRMNTEGAEEANQLSRKLEEVPDLTKFVGTEEEKISAMIAQSTLDYHPSRYLKLRNTVMSGKVPPFYKCYKCHQGGHWVTNCPLNNQDLRKSTGIPSKFLIEVTDPNTPGVMITGVGKYVVFRQNLVMGEGTQAKVRPKCSENPPEELVCLLCKEMMQDAVLTPCCVNAFCDDCLRNHLLDSDDHACPSCHKTGIGPDTLVPNRYLRLKILQFGNQFLTELPDENVNGRSDSPLLQKSRSYPGTPVVVMSPSDSPCRTKTDSPQPNANSMKNSPRSPPVLSDLRIMEEEEEKKRENKKSEDNDAVFKEGEESERPMVEETRRKKREEEGEGELEGLSQESLVTSPGSHIHEESESGLLKSKKHSKKSKKKKDGEGKEKHKKKDKEKKKSKKKKESKEVMSEGDGDGLLNTSHDEGSEKVSDPLMNEAICPTFDPSVPPPGTMPVRPRLPPRYPVNTMIPVLGAPYQPAIQPFVMHSGRYGIQSQDDDPVTTFMRYLEKKDEQKRKRLRSKSSSRSPYRDRSRPRLQPVNSYSRSRSRSVSKALSPSWNRKHHSGNSPRSRRRCSRSPTSNSRHGYRSVSRERSPSLSRSPSPGRRLMSSPLGSGHLYSSYSPHRSEIEKAREKKSFNVAPICGSDFGLYNYNSMYDCSVSIGGYGAPRGSGEKGPPRDNRRHYRHYGYDADMEMIPQVVPFKDDPRRGVSRRLIDDRRLFDDRPRSREDDWRRHRGIEEEEWNRRNPYSKGDRRHRYESRNRASPPDPHRGRGREYENPKEPPPQEGKHRRDRRREIGEDHSVAKVGSLSPSSHREERKRERKDRPIKGSRERVPEEEGRITEMKRAKEKSHRSKNKMSEEERTEALEKDRGGRGERGTGTRWGEDKVSPKENDPTTLKEVRSNTPPDPQVESTIDKEEKGRKKHEKKKKKKEKRRSSQASQEEGCPSDAAIEDDKKIKKKDKEKKRQKKVQGGEEAIKELANIGAWQSENSIQKEVPGVEKIQIGKVDPAEETVSDEAAFLPALSKWEREDEDVLSPLKASVDPEKKVEESLVTSDVIKRAENALFSKGLTNRALMPRKVYLEKSNREREKELQQEAQRSPTPEWDRADTREAKRKGGSIQITISSKTESQIGRPRFGKSDMLKETTSPTIDNQSTTKEAEADKSNVSRWDIAISPKRKEHMTMNVVKAKKVRINTLNVLNAKKVRISSLGLPLDMEDSEKDLDKTSANITTEEPNCGGPSRETPDKQGTAVGQDHVSDKDGETGRSSVLPHSQLRRGDSQEQVVSSTEEMRLPMEGQNLVLCSDIESVSQSVSSHFDKANSPTLPDAFSLIEAPPSNEKMIESDIEEGELVEEQPSEAVPDSTEDQLGREVPPYHDVAPTSLVKESFKSLLPSQDESRIPSEERVMEGQVPGPGQESSYLLGPPSPTIKRPANEVTVGDKKPKKKKRKHSSSSSSTSTSSSSSSSSDSSSEEETSRKKKKKKKKRKKKKKTALDSESSDEDDTIKDKRKKKKKKRKKRKGEKKLEKAKLKIPWMARECV